VMNPKHVSPPLVVIAATSDRNRQNVISTVKSIGKQWRESKKAEGRDVVFTWMDGGRWSDWLKSMYGIVDAGKAETPSIVVADHAVRRLRPPPSVVELTNDCLESCLLRC
jgi:thioredoxin domain-containing protein 5